MNNKEYILCAAILRKEPRTDIHPYHDNDICKIEIGYRHHDILQRFMQEVRRDQAAQGFYTSKGRFVNRKDAMIIAMNAGQVENIFDSEEHLTESDSLIKDLYSEDLY